MKELMKLKVMFRTLAIKAQIYMRAPHKLINYSEPEPICPFISP